MLRALITTILLALCAFPAAGQKTYTGISASDKPIAMYSLNGSCTAVIQPDIAVIAGGISAGGLKPTDAVRQLEKQLAAVSDYVQSQHGHLVLMERVRSLRSPGTGNGGNDDNEAPAEIVQRIHVELPAQAMVDEILDHLIQLGLDRYGDSLPLGRSRQRSVVVYFRFSNLESSLFELRQSCIQAAWKKQCVSANPPRACSGDKIPASSFLQEVFNVRSQEKLLHVNGGADYLRLSFSSWSPQRSDPPQLAGNQPIEILGDITAQYQETQQ